MTEWPEGVTLPGAAPTAMEEQNDDHVRTAAASAAQEAVLAAESAVRLHNTQLHVRLSQPPLLPVLPLLPLQHTGSAFTPFSAYSQEYFGEAHLLPAFSGKTGKCFHNQRLACARFWKVIEVICRGKQNPAAAAAASIRTGACACNRERRSTRHADAGCREVSQPFPVTPCTAGSAGNQSSWGLT